MALGFFGSAMSTPSKFREGRKKVALSRLGNVDNAGLNVKEALNTIRQSGENPYLEKPVDQTAGLRVAPDARPEVTTPTTTTETKTRTPGVYHEGLWGAIYPKEGIFTTRKEVTPENQDDIIARMEKHNIHAGKLEGTAFSYLPQALDSTTKFDIPERTLTTINEQISYLKSLPYTAANQKKIKDLETQVSGQTTLATGVDTGKEDKRSFMDKMSDPKGFVSGNKTLRELTKDTEKLNEESETRPILESVSKASESTQKALAIRERFASRTRRTQYMLNVEYKYGSPEEAKKLETVLKAEMAELDVIDASIEQLQIHQAMADLGYGNTARVNTMWSNAKGVKVTVYPRPNGTHFDVEMDGKLMHENIDTAKVTSLFRTQSDYAYSKKLTALQFTQADLIFKNKLAQILESKKSMAAIALELTKIKGAVNMKESDKGMIVAFGQNSYIVTKEDKMGLDGDPTGESIFKYEPIHMPTGQPAGLSGANPYLKMHQ